MSFRERVRPYIEIELAQAKQLESVGQPTVSPLKPMPIAADLQAILERVKHQSS